MRLEKLPVPRACVIFGGNRDAECPSGMEFFPSMATVQLVREVHSISSAVQFFYK
jgi:hypothetical protein